MLTQLDGKEIQELGAIELKSALETVRHSPFVSTLHMSSGGRGAYAEPLVNHTAVICIDSSLSGPAWDTRPD